MPNTNSKQRKSATDSAKWKTVIRDLTESDLLIICDHVTDRIKLRKLAARLKMTLSIVDSALQNDPLGEAVYQVLNTWYRDQEDLKKAHVTMCEALSDIGENLIINKVLLSQPS